MSISRQRAARRTGIPARQPVREPGNIELAPAPIVSGSPSTCRIPFHLGGDVVSLPVAVGERSPNETDAGEELGVIRKSLIAATMLLPMQATAFADAKQDLRKLAVKQVGEVIAIASLCRGLRPNVENISLVLLRVGVDFDDILDDAGKYSEKILPEMAASGGEESACAAGAAWYGPKGSKVPNFVILQ